MIACRLLRRRPLKGSTNGVPANGLLRGLKPRWKAKTHELFLGPYLVKRFRRLATAQELILDKYQQLG